MKLTFSAKWKSRIRTLAVAMAVMTAVIAVNPVTAQAKASDYTYYID